jgi:hypothetical protein
MTPKEIKEIDTLLKVLRRHGVESFEKGEIKLRVSPVKYIDAPTNSSRKKGDSVTDDDLYYSATTLKPRGK